MMMSHIHVFCLSLQSEAPESERESRLSPDQNDKSMSDRKTAAPPSRNSDDDDDDDCECIESGVEVTVIRCSDGKKNQVK